MYNILTYHSVKVYIIYSPYQMSITHIGLGFALMGETCYEITSTSAGRGVELL